MGIEGTYFNIGKKRASSINGAGKLDSYMQNNKTRKLPNTINKDKLKI